MVFAGSRYGGWWYNEALVSQGSIVYSFGLGEDTSFDEYLLQKGIDVYGFDPTPKSRRYVTGRRELFGNVGKFHYTAEGLSVEETFLEFTLPENPAHVSMRQGVHDGMGDVVVLKVDTLKKFMSRNGHEHIDVLKLDIESSEYDVLEEMIESQHFPFVQLLVEFHQRFDGIGEERHRKILDGLRRSGFIVLHQDDSQDEISFQKI